jgi:uncharacterized repeat protein (TIGR01451 family)
LDKFPPGFYPIFLEYNSGDPRLGSRRWEEKSFEKTLTPAALGQSLREQVFWAEEFLRSNHGKRKYLGKSDLEGFLGLVLTLEMENKIAFLNQFISSKITYFPHKVEPVIKEGKVSYKVIDKSSNLFDQVSLLWGLSEYRRFSNPKIKDNYDRIFGKDRPFSLESQKVVIDLVKKIFDNLKKIHYDKEDGVFNHSSSVNAGLSIVALKNLFDNFADEQEWQKEIKDLIIKEADFIINKLQNKEGGFYPPTLAAQGAAIQGLLTAHRVGNKKRHLAAAKKGFDFLEKNYWDNTLQIYRSTKEDKYVYSPLNAGLLLGALREMGSSSRIDTFLERVLEKAGLQVLPGRKELAPVLISEVKLTYPLNKKGRVVAQIGNTITYKLVVENGGELAREVTVTETLPKGFNYLFGTTRIDGKKGNEPQGPNPYEWKLGDLKSNTKVVLTYQAKVGFEANPGKNESSVTISEINPEGVRAITPPVKSEVTVEKPRLRIRKEQ